MRTKQWTIAEYGNLPTEGLLAIKNGSETLAIIQVPRDTGLSPEHVERAKLFAAAPDLAEALRRCALRLYYQTDPHTGKGVRYGEDQDAIDAARAALVKAGAVI